MDNRCVTIRPNYDKVEPTCNVQHWNKRAKEKTTVIQIRALNTYTACVWEVRKSMKNLRLSTIPLIGGKIGSTHFSQVFWTCMSYVSSWMVHKLLYGEIADFNCLLDFKKHTCVSYLKHSTFWKLDCVENHIQWTSYIQIENRHEMPFKR